MRRYLLATLFLFQLFALTAQDACNPGNQKAKLRVLGDSWAAFPFTYHSYDSAFIQYGFPEYRSVGDRTAIIGMNTESFLNPIARILWEPEIDKDVRNKVDAVVLTLLGNDLAFKKNVNEPFSVLDDAFKQSKRNLDTLVDFLHAKLPNAQILWTCYDYPNFVDPLIAFPWNPYYDQWESSGFATPAQMNEVVRYISRLQDSLVQVWDRPYVHFIDNMGLMQFKFGQLVPQQVYPFGTYPPRSVPFPGGLLEYTSPWPAMGLEGVDTYHLNGRGFTYLADYQFRAFFMDHFRRTRDTMVYSMGQSYDGWVSETGTTGTGDVLVGKQAGNIKVKGIFSFNTEFIPDEKIIKKATLFIRRKEGSYNSYYHAKFPTNFQVDIKKGTFGTAAVEATDFSEAASAADAGCFAGQPVMPDYSLRIDLIPSALSQINKSGITQFRVEITADSAQRESLIHFFNGDTTAYEGPFLDLYYDTTSLTGIQTRLTASLNLYPNPVAGRLTISPDKQMTPGHYILDIYDEKGAQVLSREELLNGNETSVDVSGLSPGTYVLRMSRNDLLFGGTFVKVK